MPKPNAPITWAGSDALRPLAVPLASLSHDPKNARRHDARNVAAVRASLERFGQQKPIVVRDGIVIAGNGTLAAAREMGWSHLAASTFVGTDEEAGAYAIADNRTAELATWDHSSLQAALQSTSPDLQAATGFNAKEIEAILSPWADPPARIEKTITYDPSAETKLIKLEVKVGDAGDIMKRIEQALVGTPYKAQAF